MARRGRARSTPSRTSPRRAPARPKPIVPEPLRDPLPLTETLSYVLIKAPVTIVQDSAWVQSKRRPRSPLTDEEWAKHVRLHPLKRDPITDQLLLGARARKRKLEEEQNIKVDVRTVGRRLIKSSPS